MPAIRHVEFAVTSTLLLPPLQQRRQLALQEGVQIVRLLQALRRFRVAAFDGRARREHGEAPLDHLVQPGHRLHLNLDQLRPRAGFDAEVVAAAAGQPGPLDQPHLDQQTGHRAERTLAGAQHIRQLASRLRRRVADQKPAQDPPRHARIPHLLEVEAEILDEMTLFQAMVAFVKQPGKADSC